SDDVIVSGGLSIAPAPVRRAVLDTPGVLDAWILDLPDQRWGSLVTAAVVPRPDVLTHPAPGPGSLDPGDRAAVRRVGNAPAGAALVEEPATTPDPHLRDLALAIREHVGEVLGRAEAPRVVVALDALPMLPTGKVDPRALRSAVEERIGTRAAWRR
ncbi:MAG: hypothetical protein ACTJGR_05825, partial [Pauljensenia sp.]